MTHEEFDAIIQDAKAISKKSQRAKLYRRAQEIFKEEAPWLTIAHTRQNLIVNQRVKNLEMSLSGGIFFSGVSLKPQVPDDKPL